MVSQIEVNASETTTTTSSNTEKEEKKNVNYMLGHVSGGAEENRRLETQHDAIRHAIMAGRLVHESIPIFELEGPIADVCCGTGIWLKDLAKELSTHGRCSRRRTNQQQSSASSSIPDFVGFDLTASAFRNVDDDDDNLALKNVQLVSHDCCQPFPPEYVGKFDLVNMRGLAYAIPEAKFGTLFRNACSLLRPGGYMQWLETDTELWTATPKTEEILQSLRLILEERSRQQLVHYMPDFMLQQYLGTTLPNPMMTDSDRKSHSERGGEGGGTPPFLSLIHFSLTAGGASRANATSNTDVNNHLSAIMLETIKLLLEGSLLKEQEQEQDKTETELTTQSRDVPMIKRCVQYIVNAQQATVAAHIPTMSGHFPLLVAQNRKE